MADSLLNPRLGQYFTPPDIVKKMVALCKNMEPGKKVLEPSCGEGAFLKHLPKDVTCVEIDPKLVGAWLLSKPNFHLCDFFMFPDYRFDTIIGNPPYVRYRDIEKMTKIRVEAEGIKELDKRANLYLYFISRCLDLLNTDGELVFITPRDFLKSTSALELNKRMAREGCFTDFYDLGDARIFENATPNCAIWRWQKGLRTYRTRLNDGRRGKHKCVKGYVSFEEEENTILASYPAMHQFFDIRVGAVSGADHIFVSEEHGNADMVCSETVKTGKTRRVIYNQKHESLIPHKQTLLNRKVRKFDESNWWMWGRDCHHKQGRRIYVNCKTRNKNPFYVSDAELYDGSVLALFPKHPDMDLKKAARALNENDWEGLGFVCDGRYLFSQRSLEFAPVPLPRLTPSGKVDPSLKKEYRSKTNQHKGNEACRDQHQHL